MKGRILAAALFAAAISAGAGAHAQPAARERPQPVVVELYTSQGCITCPRANRLLGEFSREQEVLALTFAVGYWDYLGWRDTFAQPEFTSRQRAYSRTLRFRGPFTPQLIIGGMRQVSAADWDESRAALEEVKTTAPADGAPQVSVQRIDGNQVRIEVSGGGPQVTPADIWLVAYDPGPLTVLITSGDNANRRVTHYNLVRRVTRVGAWNGEPIWLERPRCTPECAVLVQAPNGGRILAFDYTRRRQR